MSKKTHLQTLLPIRKSTHDRARSFANRQLTRSRFKSAYLSYLAMESVRLYLDCMEIETASTLDNGAIRDSAPIALLDPIADLDIGNVGSLACLPVFPNSQFVNIPAEVWNDRFAYVGVRLNQELTEAELLGFTRKANAEFVAIGQLKSMETLIEYIDRWERSVKLNQWLENTIDRSWNVLESVLAPRQIAWRSKSIATVDRPQTNPKIARGKRIYFDGDRQGVTLMLEQIVLDRQQREIWVEIYPPDGQDYLPALLQFQIYDGEDVKLFEAESRSTPNIQVKFAGEVGELFTVVITLSNTRICEHFVI